MCVNFTGKQHEEEVEEKVEEEVEEKVEEEEEEEEEEGEEEEEEEEPCTLCTGSRRLVPSEETIEEERTGSVYRMENDAHDS
ncbi:hypothetical protein GBF38_002675 [Nibea albiflora]|uniref:Uncharacterized protein n=1 Tax=Nibea albiflora TaxID=240163 RepID=A0ACB7EHI0_NIBAL|nr:hypothetical protein GBF38_002675 [Nibea albiflora]